MSLAATLARDGVRPASFLPAIKCSTCGIEIEISALADHVCSGQSAPVTAPAPAPAPCPSPPKSRIPNLSNPFKLRQQDTSDTPPAADARVQEERERTQTRTLTLNKKPSRIALPKINANAANQSFLSPRPKFEAPITPASSGGKLASLRNMISPMPRQLDQRPPSPELSANLDCAFPPFPTSGSSTPGRPSTSHGRRTPALDSAPSRAESRAASRNEQHNLTVEDPYSYEPKRPRLNGGENVLQRFNTLKSGPFAAKRQGSAESTKDASAASHLRKRSAVEANRPATALSTHSRPVTPAMSQSQSEIGDTTKKATPPSRPLRPSEEVFSPTFLDQFSTEPEDASIPKTPGLDHNKSFPASPALEPVSSGLQTLAKQRSEPALRSFQRRPSLANPPPSALPLPVRSPSRNELRTDPRMQDAPPVPKPVSQHRQKESSHAPSESDASTISTTHSSPFTDHTYSTRPSPAGSVEALSPLANALSKTEDDEQLRPARLNIRAQQKPGERAELPRQASPPRAFNRPPPVPPTPSKREDFYTLESPMDPNMPRHRAAASFEAPLAPSSPLRTRTPVEVPRVDPVSRPPLPVVAQEPSLDDHDVGSHSSSHYGSRAPSEAGDSKSAPQSTFKAPPTSEQPQQRRHARRPTVSHKAMCRGCGHMIEGKSVKAADGRLTGRWHKACFVCRTCDAPFLTADFYVINNHPYCEHHYHEQNDSLCHGCNRGIEGQYLETTTSTRQGVIDKKYHPRCFTCSQCRVILTDDYFEISCRVYCERHALAAMRVQAHAAGVQGLYPTDHRAMMAGRRTTRLINPMMT
ncbi:hypothetical protein CERZMDRAFT_86719 [Cercospora zeae-maydis SCOH1-5]|uniref:LIM zinc-binding domain-containing protein n=1 Tax=Cercospora zeae-maydis SCOH1-5 TaxID=717836 RepID=A0A6A6F8R6_9PEZI|nr:hypothetical protein CERZMDRAFT_86719 [Cercospora zeae-maydis SCOH1-5]